MGAEQAALHSVKLTRGAKGEMRWELETSGMEWKRTVDRAVLMDIRLTETYYPEELEAQAEEE